MLAIQLLINSVALGAAYALIALGFVLVLNATTAVNFAHGETVVAGGFLAVALAMLLPAGTLPGIVLLPAVLAVMAAFGIVLSWLVYMPLRDRPPVSVFISTIAFGIVSANTINAIFGAAPHAGPPLFGGAQVTLGPVSVGNQALATIGVAGLLLGATGLLLTRTQLGRRLRACAQDPEMARAVGIDLTRMTMLAFALATALAGAAGLMLANQFFVSAHDGGGLMLKAYIATVIGGWGSLRGAAAGALLIAIFEVFVAAALSQPVAEGLLYLALFAMLALRPQGLFGEAAQQRA
jgi:branched-chain amino acid transport system permease protein